MSIFSFFKNLRDVQQISLHERRLAKSAITMNNDQLLTLSDDDIVFAVAERIEASRFDIDDQAELARSLNEKCRNIYVLNVFLIDTHSENLNNFDIECFYNHDRMLLSYLIKAFDDIGREEIAASFTAFHQSIGFGIDEISEMDEDDYDKNILLDDYIIFDELDNAVSERDNAVSIKISMADYIRNNITDMPQRKN